MGFRRAASRAASFWTPVYPALTLFSKLRISTGNCSASLIQAYMAIQENTPLNEALTFDDVLLVPRYSAVTPPEVDLQTSLTPQIKLKVPIISAAMDKV